MYQFFMSMTAAVLGLAILGTDVSAKGSSGGKSGGGHSGGGARSHSSGSKGGHKSVHHSSHRGGSRQGHASGKGSGKRPNAGRTGSKGKTGKGKNGISKNGKGKNGIGKKGKGRPTGPKGNGRGRDKGRKGDVAKKGGKRTSPKAGRFGPTKGGKLSGKARSQVRQARMKITDAQLRKLLMRLILGQSLSRVEIVCLTEFVDDPDCGLTDDEQDGIMEGVSLYATDDDDDN